MAVCLLIQAMLTVVVLRIYISRYLADANFCATRTLHMLIIVMLALVTGNFLQVSVWATLFIALGEFSNFSEAVYHSAVNFATLGYGDIVMSDQHKLLGPLQAINGVLMIGVSTSVLMSCLQDALMKARKAKLN